MASIGKLVAAIAVAEGMDEGSVKLIARYAREAGFISQGTYGPGAAKMTSKDAANLLIAVNASALAKDAAVTILLYSDAKRSSYYTPTLEAGLRPSAGSIDEIIFESLTLGRFIKAIVEGLMPVGGRKSKLHEEWDAGHFEIDLTFQRPWARAQFMITSRLSDEDEPPPRAQVLFYSDVQAIDGDKYPDRWDETGIGLKTLVAVAQTIAN